ncbi:MAG: hypothetical protein A6F70_07275 [Cycloclasticus sp. symbiont of Bathymodiolus heckerae]|nr:MAG: hypothetical protein A6F70_07275 [Cycloclasticus sp. symbiont of Bathymodiolus heckerae]
MITGDEAFYNSLQKFDWYYMDEKEEYLEAKKYIQNSDKVLEIGSGKGAFAKHLPTKDYVGLDFSSHAKKMAAENGITVEIEMVEDYAKKHRGEFDVVASFQVLEHVSEPKAFIESKLEALRPGGKLIIAVPSEDSFLRYVNNGILNMPPHHVTRWSDATFKFIAEKYDLNMVSIYHEKVQDMHKQWYLSTLISSCLFSSKLIDLSVFRKISEKCINFFSKILVKELKSEMLPAGHTVLVVLQKSSVMK